MTHILEDDSKTYTAVVNDEEQHSIWPADRPLPGGWSRVGPQGTRQEVLAYIEKHWTDMRPRSLQKAMRCP